MLKWRFSQDGAENAIYVDLILKDVGDHWKALSAVLATSRRCEFARICHWSDLGHHLNMLD